MNQDKPEQKKKDTELLNDKAKKLRDFNLLIEENGFIKLMGLKIRSYEGFHLARITIAVAIFISILSIGILFSKNTFFYSLAAAFICYIIPVEFMKKKISAKGRQVLSNLPDVIDLMASLLKAGLTLDQTISYLAGNYNNPISRLFKIYQLKVFEGLSKKEAFDFISSISFCPEFRSLLKIIYQAEVVGNPVVGVLKDLSSVYRNNQRDLLKMRAEKLESNLIVVIFLFIFLPMLAVFLIPVLPHIKFL